MFYRNLIVLMLTCLLLASCSGSGNPVTGQIDNLTPGREFASSDSSSHELWGYWIVSINPVTLEVESVPIRTTEFTCNVTQFMQPPSQPINMISFTVLAGSAPANGYFEVDVTLRHPFPGLKQYRGFDVRGLLITDGNYALTHDTSASYSGPGDTMLLNADGYSRWWNPTEFTSFGTIFGYTPGGMAPAVYPSSTINPYKYFTGTFTEDEPVWTMDTTTRGTFPVDPGIYTRQYNIQFAMDGPNINFDFNYAIDASWEKPDPSGEPDYDVESFPLSANMAEPYCISVVDNGSTAYYENPDSFGGTLDLAVRVYDWQSVENPDGVAGELSGLWLDSPVFTNPVDILSTATILPDGPTSSVFEVSLGNLNLTQSGDEIFWVIAETSDGIGYQPQVNGGDFFDYPDAVLGSYYLTSVHILDEGSATDAPIVLTIDPNEGVSGEELIDVIVGGLNFANGAWVELRNNYWDTIEADNEVMSGGGTVITCDINLELAAAGSWDVVVINPDMQEGILEDGFTVYCPEAVHTYEGKYHLTAGLYYNYCQRGDICILETGPYTGEAVLKRSYDSGGVYTGNYIRFDPDNPTDVVETDFFSLPGRYDSEVAYVTMTTQIDQNPVNGHIGVINGRMFDIVQLLDENGIWIEDVKIDAEPETYVGKYPVIPALDFDMNGDMWMVIDIRGEWPGGGIPNEDALWQLRHYELQETAPYYVENLSDRLDITEDLKNPDEPDVAMQFIADIAISYTEDSMIIFAAGGLGTGKSNFVKYDLTTSPPTLVINIDLLPSIAVCGNPYSGITRADLEFDHSDLSLESCRLMVMYQTWNGSSIDQKFMRLDTDLNVLGDEIVDTGLGAWNNPHAFTFNVDSDNRNIIAFDMANDDSKNDFYYFPMPLSGW